jgi:hypothetical protein
MIFISVMEISTFSAHPADGLLTRRDLSREHFCNTDCGLEGNQKQCLQLFYAKAKAKDVINPERLTNKLPDWEPLIDQAVSKLKGSGENSWYNELIPYIHPIETFRNTTYESVQVVENFTIDLKNMTSEMIEETVASFLCAAEKCNPKLPTYIPITLHGDHPSDRSKIPDVRAIPSKIIAGVGHKLYLEIMIPIIESDDGYYIDTKVNLHPAIKTLFRTEDSNKIFVAHNARASILIIELVLKSLANGHDFEFGRYMDTAVVWTRYGGYARDEYDLIYMYRYIIGGIHYDLDRDENPDQFQMYASDNDKYVLVNAVSELRVLEFLYLSFFIITLPSVFPSKRNVLANLSKWSADKFVSHFFYVMTESVAGIDFDYKRYLNTPPKFRYKAGSDQSPPDERILVNYFQNRTIKFRTSVGMEIERTWPTIYYINREDWSEDRKSERNFIWNFAALKPLLFKAEINRIPNLIKDQTNKFLEESSNLLEILNFLDSNRLMAWKILERKLKQTPELAIQWLSNASPVDNYKKSSFIFGSFGNYKKLRTIAFKLLPEQVPKNPHYNLHIRNQKGEDFPTFFWRNVYILYGGLSIVLGKSSIWG